MASAKIRMNRVGSWYRLCIMGDRKGCVEKKVREDINGKFEVVRKSENV